MKATVLAPVLLLAATGATAVPPAEQADRAASQEAVAPSSEAGAGGTDAPEQKEKKICRTERATGSLTRRTRVCLTEAQWREINANTYRGINDMTRDRVGGGTTTSN